MQWFKKKCTEAQRGWNGRYDTTLRLKSISFILLHISCFISDMFLFLFSHLKKWNKGGVIIESLFILNGVLLLYNKIQVHIISNMNGEKLLQRMME